MPEKVPVQGGGDAEEAQQGAEDDLHHLQPAAHVDEEHGRTVGEDVGHDEGGDGKLRGVDAGLHGVCLGDGRAGVGREGHRRGDVRHDAEVEHEEVRRHVRQAHLDEDGCAGGGHDAEVGRGGHAHAQHDAAEHGEEEADEHGEGRDGHKGGDGQHAGNQLGGKARHGDAARDHARHAAGHGHGDGALAAGLQGLQDLLGGQALLVVEEAHQDRRQDGEDRGPLHGGGTGAHQPHQQHQGGQQVDLGDEVPPLGQLAHGDALEAQLLGLQMDGDEDAGEVEHRREDGLHGHGGVGDLHVLRQQEGGGAHDGGHDLPAGGGGGLHGPGELRLVAGLLHHGDGDRARGNGVAHGGAGDHAAEGGGDDGHLGRAAGGPAGQLIGERDEEVGNAGALQEGAEDDEEDDVLIAGADGGSDGAGGGVEQGVGHPAQHLEEGLPRGGEEVHEGVDEERAHDEEDGQAHAAAAELHEAEDADNGDDDLGETDVHGHLDDLHGVGGIVEEAARAHDHEKDIVPGHVVGADVVLAGGVIEVADDHDAAQEGGEADLLSGGAEEGHADAVQGEDGHQPAQGDLLPALPDADVGLPVILLHDLVHVHPGVGILRSGSGMGLFQETHRGFLPFSKAHSPEAG